MTFEDCRVGAVAATTGKAAGAAKCCWVSSLGSRAHSSAGERPLHTREVPGSIPGAPIAQPRRLSRCSAGSRERMVSELMSRGARRELDETACLRTRSMAVCFYATGQALERRQRRPRRQRLCPKSRGRSQRLRRRGMRRLQGRCLVLASTCSDCNGCASRFVRPPISKVPSARVAPSTALVAWLRRPFEPGQTMGLPAPVGEAENRCYSPPVPGIEGSIYRFGSNRAAVRCAEANVGRMHA
jgi:hypothetical protein